MSVNKVIYGSNVLIDLTGDTATKDKVLSGFTIHDATGAQVEGTCTYDSDTQDATVKVAEMLSGTTAYARGTKLEGTMPNNGAKTLSISKKADSVTIPQGYHDGSGKAQISSTEQAKIIASSIKSGISILGVTGTYGGESVSVQAKSVTPKTTAQTILPDSGYDYLSQVTVAKIPYVESSNSAGGTTVTIG